MVSRATSYLLLQTAGVPVKMWTRGVPVEPETINQLSKVASLPIVYSHVAAMPDIHVGIGSTVGTVIPTIGAIIPSAVGVDIGCGMCAVKTPLHAKDLPNNLKKLRTALEEAIPHGRSDEGGKNDIGSWNGRTRYREMPQSHMADWVQHLSPTFKKIVKRHPKLGDGNTYNQLGTLGTGNHFIELCLDESENVWCLLHSGSRGVGNRIGTYFIELAKKDMKKHINNLPDKDLAYLKEGTDHFDDYVQAVGWAQEFARINRKLMMETFLSILSSELKRKDIANSSHLMAVNCHHNYVQREWHFGKEVFITRKGALNAAEGTMGIIPGSMGASTFIVRGKANPESFNSCSHGAGRVMSRTAAKKKFTLDDHIQATKFVECRKDSSVIDETPMAYKDINAVMDAQADLIEVVHTLKQIVCVKG